mgnify:CR=1 FL=1
MPSETAATSPAAQTNGDGKQSTAANVSQADVIAHFIKRDNDRSAAPQTTDTKATEAKAAPAESSPKSTSVAEPAPADLPEAETPEATATPAAPEANETEGEAEPEVKADDVLSPESQTLDQKTKEKIQKRIDKEVGKRKALEAQLEQVKSQQEALAAQLQQSQQQQAATPPVAPIANAPLPDIKDPASLVEYRNQAKQTVRWAEEALDRDDIDQGIQVGEKVLSKAEVKAIMRNARVALEDKIPAQQEFFQQQAQVETRRQQVWTAAVTKMPFLADKDNQEVTQTVNYLRQSNPALLSSPNAAWDVGLMILGARALMAQNKPADAEKPKAASTPPPALKPKAPSDQTVTSTTATAPRTAASANPTIRQPSGNQTAQSTAQYLAAMDAARQAGRRG